VVDRLKQLYISRDGRLGALTMMLIGKTTVLCTEHIRLYCNNVQNCSLYTS